MEVRQKEIEEFKTDITQGDLVIIDIRDPSSFEAEHIPGALAIGDSNIEEFVGSADKSKKTVIYCYHGNSSMGAVEYFQEQGFTDVYSLAGGFAAWESSQ